MNADHLVASTGPSLRQDRACRLVTDDPYFHSASSLGPRGARQLYSPAKPPPSITSEPIAPKTVGVVSPVGATLKLTSQMSPPKYQPANKAAVRAIARETTNALNAKNGFGREGLGPLSHFSRLLR